jgi:hypothetical protein
MNPGAQVLPPSASYESAGRSPQNGVMFSTDILREVPGVTDEV